MAAVVLRLDGETLTRIEELASKRRQHAIITLTTSSPPWTEKEAEDANLLDDHRKGVAAEYAVAQWLDQLKVPHDANFENVQADFAGDPDILVDEPFLRCDVKAIRGRYPESQRPSLDRKDLVIWCYSRPDVIFAGRPFRAKTVAFLVDIYGWTDTGAVKALPFAKNGWIDVPDELIRELPELIAKLGR